MNFQCCLTPNTKSPALLTPTELSLDALHQIASNPPQRASKDGQCIIPVAFRPPRSDGLYDGENHQPSPLPYRKAVNVYSVNAFLVDIDGASEDEFQAFLAHVGSNVLDSLIWFTFSHGIKPGIRARAAFSLSRPIVIGSPRRWTLMWEELCRYVGLEKLSAADKSCKDAARLQLMPACSLNSTPTAPIRLNGQPIDVDKVLECELAMPSERYVEQRSTLALTAEEEAKYPADIESLKKRLKKFRKDKYRSVINDTLAGRSLATPGQRHQALLILTEALAWVAEPNEQVASLLQVAAASLGAMHVADPHAGVWEHAETCLWGAIAKRERWEEEIKERERVQVQELATLFEMSGAVR